MKVDEAVKLVAQNHQLLENFVRKLNTERATAQLAVIIENRRNHPAFHFKLIEEISTVEQISIVTRSIVGDDKTFNLLRLEAWMYEYSWILHFCRALPPNIIARREIPSDKLAEALRVMFEEYRRTLPI